MLRRPVLLAVAALLLSVTSAYANSGPYRTNALGAVNFRTGPGTNYPVITTVPRGQPVFVFRCTNTYAWCDAAYAGARGWVSGRYIGFAAPGLYYNRPLSSVGAALGIPRLVPNYPVYRPNVVYRNYPVAPPPRGPAFYFGVGPAWGPGPYWGPGPRPFGPGPGPWF
ncbi:SH3 domain-containing protein [Roseibium sp. RKSG952]|uniref:SH3 domain-containing protein n=1 Tax=Roseibium sp. RKSG952 TaxID=2529384 RepID=UPI0012BD6D7B|nr:SH3 domain-containing protein [Roseibium sp. RKSG952]MTH97827.1 hypothetical protein [Roseibium sp. RKSG952]